jgi:hypothetical protein
VVGAVEAADGGEEAAAAAPACRAAQTTSDGLPFSPKDKRDTLPEVIATYRLPPSAYVITPPASAPVAVLSSSSPTLADSSTGNCHPCHQ